MFGKPEWFHKKRFGWGLTPNTWQGWGYLAAWLAVAALPFFLFQHLGKTPESLIWISAVLGGLVWDVRHIRREIAETVPSDIFVIDEDTDISQLTTRNYDMNLRD